MIRMFLLASSLTASLVAQTPPPNPPQFVAWPKLPRYVESIALQTKPPRVWVAGEGLFRSSVRPVPGDPKRSGFEDVTPPAIPSDRQTIFDIKFSEDGSLGWIAGRNGQIYRTKDAGETWIAATMTPVPERFSEGDFRRISFSPDGRRGIGLAQHGIWFSEDSGEHWTRTLRQDAWSDACLLADGRTAWAVGVGGWTTQSKDGGRTWKEVSASTFVPVIPGFKQHLNLVVFHANGRQGWIAGDGNTIIRTQNGGRSWHRATVPADAYIESIVDLAFDTSGQYGWAVARGGSDGGLLLRSADWGENWDITSAVPANYRALAMAADGLSGWAVAGTSVLQTLTKTAAPKIKHFAVIPPDLTPEITFEDEDTPQEKLRGTIEVEGPGLGLGGNKVRVTFGSDADGLDWPKGAFAEGQKYTFHLRVFDGWNVTAQDLEYAPSKGGKAVSSIPAPIVGLDLPELKGLDLSKATVRLDGAPMAVAQIITRGGDGTLTLKPSADTLQKLRDGFHSITVSNGLPNVMRQIGFYKEQLTLKLFRPYRRSYALVVAVGDYPAGSGFSKLTSAVPQGRKLEAALRSQGFEILPSLYDRDATRSRIETAIRSAPAGPEDRLFIYFGGHGDEIGRAHV